MSKHRLELLRTVITSQGDEVELYCCANCQCRILLTYDRTPYSKVNEEKLGQTCEEFIVWKTLKE